MKRKPEVIQRALGVIALAMLIAFAALTMASFQTDNSGPVAVEGVLDLREWDIQGGKSLRLNGDWEFYWNSLLTPEDMAAGRGDMSGYTGPRYWKGYVVDGEVLPGQGYATYVLRILMNPDGQRMAIRLPSQSTAWRLFMNGREVAADGVVGTSLEKSIPKYMPMSVQFTNDYEEITLVMQVSNYHHRRGGMWDAPEIGSEMTLRIKNARLMFLDMISIGSMFSMGLYHFLLFAMRRKDRSALYFSGICFCYGVHTLVVGEMTAVRIFPYVNWSLQLRLEYLTSGGLLPLSLLFVWELYPEVIKKAAVNAGIALFALLLVITVFFTTVTVSEFTLFYQAGSATLSSYILYSLIVASRRKLEGAPWLATSAAIFLVTLANDFLYYNGFAQTEELSSRGLVFVCYSQAYVLAARFTSASISVETLRDRLAEANQQLTNLNRDLEERVSERTSALVESNKRLEAMNAEIEHMEESRKRLLTNVAHDLRTPVTLIQGYVEAMLDGVIEDPEERNKYLGLIAGKAAGLSHLIADLFELTQLESRRVVFDIRPVPADDLMREVFMKCETDIMNAGIHPVLEKPPWSESPEESRPYVMADPERIDRVMSNLIYNAVKFTRPGGTITISYRIKEPDPKTGLAENMIFSVADNGQGITPEDLPYIFDRFYKTPHSRNDSSGSGIGLSIARETVEMHGGHIWVESSPGSGSVFSFTLRLAT